MRVLRPVFFALLSMFFINSVAYAMWAKMPDAELIDRSTLIVSARLLGITQVTFSAANIEQRVGILEIDKVFKGDRSAHYVLLALPSTSGPQVSTRIDYPVETSGIWLLRDNADNKGLFYADNPQRFWSIDKTPVLEKLLQK